MGKRFFKNSSNGNCQPNNRTNNKFNKQNFKKRPGNKVDKPKVEPFNPNVKGPLYDKARLLSSWKINRKIGPGLVNGFNTCFLNSVLQCLTYTPALAQFFLKDHHFDSCTLKKQGFCAMCAMGKHVDRCLKEPKSFARNSAILPRYFTSNLRALSRNLRLGRQEDAHELYMFILSALQKAATHGLGKLPPQVEETSFIYQVFGGKLRSQLKCYSCQATSDNYEACLDLSVDLNNKVDSLEKALASFTKVDVIGGDDPSNRYRCDACKQMVKAGKQMTVSELPLMLTVHLKRFAFDLQRGDMRKIMSKVDYPTALNMAPYVSSEKNIKQANYDLYAVLVHMGYGCDSGHYYAYVKAPNGQWYKTDDEDVFPVSEEEVLDQNAYMLFYQQGTTVVAPAVNASDAVVVADAAVVADAVVPSHEEERSPSPPPAIQEPSEPVPCRSVLSDIQNKKKTKKRVAFEPVVLSDNPTNWIVQSSNKPHRSLRGNLSPPTYSANIHDESSWIVSSRDEFKQRQSEKTRRKIRVKLAAKLSRWAVNPY